MTYQLKAEYEFRAILAWHIAPEASGRSLCGRPLAPAAPVRPIRDLVTVPRTCRTCEILHAQA